MIGVVLWSDLEDRKAVFWCEDHGDLAYYDASMDTEDCDSLLNAGDMVEFELRLESKVRRAQHPFVIKPKVCHGLEEHLRASAAAKEASTGRSSGKVVAFAPKRASTEPQRQMRSG